MEREREGMYIAIADIILLFNNTMNPSRPSHWSITILATATLPKAAYCLVLFVPSPCDASQPSTCEYLFGD